MNLPNFPDLDLFSAAVNALNGAIVGQNPSHNRGYTFAGILIMALLGGIGGGTTRDVLLNQIPSPFTDPRCVPVCILMGLLGMGIYRYFESKEELFHTRLRAYLKSFSLPWFAILGSHKALDHGLGYIGAILVGLVATTAGGVLIDLFSRLTPVIVRADQQHATTAVLASLVYITLALHVKSLPFFPVTLIAFLFAFTFRVLAVRDHWGSIMPRVPLVEGPEVVPSVKPTVGPVARG